jgi:carbon storage regulator CsrA
MTADLSALSFFIQLMEGTHMLVISVKPGEGVTIGSDIKLWNRGENNITIAIEAPKEVAILRDSAKVKK